MRTPGLGHQTARAVSPSYSAPHPQSSNVGMTLEVLAKYSVRDSLPGWGVLHGESPLRGDRTSRA